MNTKIKNMLSKKILPSSYLYRLSIVVPPHRSKKKISDAEFSVPGYDDAHYLCTYNYRLAQLRDICKYYKLKKSGKKDELVSRIYTFLCLSKAVIVLQKYFRRYIQFKLNNLRGPAGLKRNRCVNKTDFFTMEAVEDISPTQFFSYEDDDGLVYGFDSLSFRNLILKSGKPVLNPYNRKIISDKVQRDFVTFIETSVALGRKIYTILKENDDNLSTEKRYEMRCLSIFQHIDSLGNYSDMSWFTTLEKNNLIKFVRELADIWVYRAQLTDTIKREICPPVGNPFSTINLNELTYLSMDELRHIIVSIIEQLVKAGITRDSQALGAYYVLSALTLVSPLAASALPWLYESVAHNN